MFRTRAVVSAAALCLLAVACKKTLPDSEVAARVNGEAITKKEFEEAVERNMARYKGQGHALQPNIEARIKESVLRRLIDDKMIELKAKEQKLMVPDEELNAKFAEHKGRFRTEQAFADYLKRSQNTEQNMRDDLRRNMLRDRVVEKLSGEVNVTDDEVKKYYDENLARFKDREQIKASRILVRTAPNMTDAEKKKAKAQAQQLAKEAKKPAADFAKLARESSNGPEASRDGDLNWLNRGRMPPEFDNVAFALKPNEVSDVIETRSGFEIVKVFERKDERQKPLEEVKETIQTSLLARKKNEKRREVLRDLKAQAKVEQLIKFDTQGPTPPLGMEGAPGEPMARPAMPGAADPHAMGGPEGAPPPAGMNPPPAAPQGQDPAAQAQPLPPPGTSPQ